MCIKGFKVVFYVSGSLIDDKNVHKGLIKVVHKGCWLKKFKIEYGCEPLDISRLKRVMALRFCTLLELYIRM